MSKDLSIPRRNKINWHYVRDDNIFSTIKVVSRHQDTQQYGVILPIELTNEDIRNTTAYKEYYAYATRVAAPKPKASARKKRGDSDTSLTPPIVTLTSITTAAPVPRLSAANKGKQPTRATTHTERTNVERTEAEKLKMVLRRSRQETHISQQHGSDTDEGTGSRPGVLDVPSDDSKEELLWNSSDDEDVDAQDKGDKNDESDDGNDDDDDDNDDEEELAKNDDDDTESGKGGDEVSESEGRVTKKKQGKRKRKVLIQFPELLKEGRGLQLSQNVEDSYVTLTPVHPDGLQESSSVSSFITSMLNPISDVGVESIFTTASSPIVSLQTPTPIMTPSTIATITTSKAIREAVQIQTDQLQDSFQRENDEFLRNIDENMKKIIKGQVKSQVKEQVLRILPRIKQSVNATLEAEVLTRSSHSSRTSYDIAADLSKMELKKILIEKMEGNKSIQRSDEQQNLYKALVKDYDADKTIIDTYGESTILKRRREDDDQEGPSARSARGEGGEHASASTPSETATGSAGRSTTGSQSRQLSASESNFAEEPVQTTCQMEEPSHLVFEIGAEDQPIVQTSQHPKWFSQPRRPPSPDSQQYPHNLLQPLPLIPDNRGRRVIPFEHFINNDVEYLRGGALSRKYTTSVTKTKAADYRHIKWIKELVLRAMWIQEPINYDRHALWGVSHWGQKRQQFYGFTVNRESALDVYSKRRIIAVTELKIMEWHNYKHLDWISVRRDNDKIYKFKEGDFKRLRLQNIKYMLLLLVQGKLSNLTVEERFAFNISQRMFTRSIVIQRRVEDLQLGVKSYQKRLNLTKPDTDGTFNDVRKALDDRLKGIRMQYLPTAIWRRGDKDRAAAMIQAIDKMLKTRRIMRSLEKFVGGRLYEGDFRMLQRTI
nr:hypothetical protein [Tanacetum cinerariifolium]